MTLPNINTQEHLIHGAVLKCVDGRWSADDESMTGSTLLVHDPRRPAPDQ
jgi:hypothetical protein